MIAGRKGSAIVRRLFTQLARIRGMKLADEVDRDLKENVYKPKKHPGRTSLSFVPLNDKLRSASEVLLCKNGADNAAARKDATAFDRHLTGRKPPLEDAQLRHRAMELERQMLASAQTKQVAPDQKKTEERILKKLRQHSYHWEPIEYDVYRGMLYILARAAPDYAVLTHIFTEVKKRLPQFAPKAIMDFGSGIGTVLWAAHGVWGEDIKEYFAVDTSSDMNDIARLLAQNGHEGVAPFLRQIYFRQFLPASHTLRYDLVVGAFSLMELPNRDSRLLTIDNLWRKTDRFLVLVENGTNAGYRLIMEARTHLIRNASESNSNVKVFSPCSHELSCPRIRDEIPCNFDVGYTPMTGGRGSSVKEITRFSYVVLEKRPADDRPSDDHDWPRIVSEVLPRARHVVCRTCNSDGKLKEVIVTSAKHGKELYKCARASRCGDRLPVTIDDEDLVEEELN